MTVSAIERVAAASVEKVLNGTDMSVNKVHNMDIIPDARTVRRVIIRTMNDDAFPLSFCRFQVQENEVRFRIVSFPDPRAGIRSSGVEISE